MFGIKEYGTFKRRSTFITDGQRYEVIVRGNVEVPVPNI